VGGGAGGGWVGGPWGHKAYRAGELASMIVKPYGLGGGVGKPIRAKALQSKPEKA